jgi:uncharacterized protein YjbI with pentapeptide repeats
MADSEDLKLLASGELDLSRCDFRDADLSGMDLRGRNFSYCLFKKAKCEGTRFDGSDFRNSKVSFMRAKGATFNGCDLTSLHFGYTDLSDASLKDVKANQTIFQHTKLLRANIQGASLGGGRMDVDTVLEGIISDERTDFDGLKVLRPTSRNPLFRDYTFENGTLRRRSVTATSEPEELSVQEQPAQNLPSSEHQQIEVSKSQLQLLMQNAILTRLTAQQFAFQIEEALRNVPAAHGNKLAEPLQTMLEFADVLRNLAPDDDMPEDPLDRGKLETRIEELEKLVYQLTDQLYDETKARKAAEELAASDGFMANFRKSAGKTAGIVAVSASASIVTVGVPAAAVFFLGAEHPAITSILTVIGRMPK